MATDITVKLAVEGEKNFTSAIKAANSEIKELDAKLKAAESGFDEFTSGEEQAAKKSDLLQQKIAVQKSKLEILNQQYQNAKNRLNELGDALEKATQEHGEGSAEAVKAATAYNQQAAAVAKLGAQVEATNADINNGTKELNELAQGADDASESASNLSTFWQMLGANLASAGIQAGISALESLGSAALNVFKDAIDGYAQYEQLIGGVETLFGSSADIISQYARNAFQTAGLSANEYMETVTSFSASLISSLGGDTETAARIADEAIVDMSDNANKMGSSMESIQNAYQGFAKQNYTMLDNLKLGYGGTKTEMERLLQDAEAIKAANGEMASYSIDSFSDVVEAIHVVQTEMGITGTTAREAAATIEGSVNTAKAAWANVKGLAEEAAGVSSGTGALSSLASAFSNAGDHASYFTDKLAGVIKEVSDLDVNSALIAQYQLLSSGAQDAALSAEELADKQANLDATTAALKNAYPELLGGIDAGTDAWNNQLRAIEAILDAQKEMARVELLTDASGGIRELRKLQQGYEDAQQAYDDLQADMEQGLDVGDSLDATIARVQELQEELSKGLELGTIEAGDATFLSTIAQIEEELNSISNTPVHIEGLADVDYFLEEIGSSAMTASERALDWAEKNQTAAQSVASSYAELSSAQQKYRALVESGAITMQELRDYSGDAALELSDLGITAADVGAKVASGALTAQEASVFYL